MAELLFRRGSIQNLDNAPITPGAISITTDEPGIYLDLDSNEPGAGGVKKRVRVGDFIPVDSLDDLQASLQNGTKFSTTALYYVANKNMLLRYDGNQFVWINDFSELRTLVNKLQVADSTLQGNIDNVSSALAEEVTARTEAVTNLQDQINTITGSTGSGVSLTSLKAALDQEILDRTTADSTHTKDIATNKSNIDSNSGKITDLTQLVGTVPVTGKTVVQHLTDLIAAEADTARANEQRIESTADSALDKANTNASNLAKEQSRAEAAEQALGERITGNANSISGLDQELDAEIDRAKKAENEISASVSKNAGEITRIEEKFDKAVTNLTSDISGVDAIADSALEKANTNATNLANEITNRQTAITNLRDELVTADNGIKDRLDAAEGNINTNASDIASNLGKINEEILRAEAAEKDLQDAIDDNAQDIANEATARQNAIDSINETIGGINLSITNANADIAKNAEEIAKLQLQDTAFNNSINTLGANLSAEITRATTAEGNLQTSLTAEIARSKDAEQQLQANLNAEIGDRRDAVADALIAANKYTDDEIASLEKEITDNIAAANSMMFKGEVQQFSDLPTTNIEGGWTYLVTKQFNGHNYHIGDLLVASADYTGAAHTPGSAAQVAFWIHVNTGYSSWEEVKLAVEDGKIELQSHVGDTLSTIAVASGSKNIATSISGSGTDCTINVNFVWDTF